MSSSKNPTVILQTLVDENRDFFLEQKAKYERQVSECPNDAGAHCMLASYLEDLGDIDGCCRHYETSLALCEDSLVHYEYGLILGKHGRHEAALKQLLTAQRLDPMSRDVASAVACTQQRVDWALVRESLQMQIDAGAGVALGKRRDVVRCDALSFYSFFERFALTSTPVIITDISVCPSPWTVDFLQQCLSGKTAFLKQRITESVEWAQLEESDVRLPLSSFFENLQSSSTDKQYLFDWSLPREAPELLVNFSIPKYFSQNFLLRSGSNYSDAWPSLFVGPEGSSCGLHIDSMGTSFWMFVMQGVKAWKIFPREHTAFLYPTDCGFGVDVSATDEHQSDAACPLLKYADWWECEVSEGDLLFVPAGCAHTVRNMSTTIAVSGNYVDASNLELARRESSRCCDHDFGAGAHGGGSDGAGGHGGGSDGAGGHGGGSDGAGGHGGGSDRDMEAPPSMWSLLCDPQLDVSMDFDADNEPCSRLFHSVAAAAVAEAHHTVVRN